MSKCPEQREQTFLLLVKGMDLTRKSITGPGNSMWPAYRDGKPGQRIQVEIDTTRSQFEQIDILFSELAAVNVNIGRTCDVCIDDQGRILAFKRGLCIGALVPLKLWAGVFFVGKLAA